MPASEESASRQRLDKWLWFARVVKTREAAAALIETGHVRLNGVKTLKAGHGVKAGDVLTIVLSARVRVLTIIAFAERRGGAETARLLYGEKAMSPTDGEPP